MSDRTDLSAIARQASFSEDATRHMLDAIQAGGGRAAQFNHPEFGGLGQWMAGGMVMTSNLFDHALQARIAALCAALADISRDLPSTRVSATGGRDREWWPEGLGRPGASGSQNDASYAFFPGTRRLAVRFDGRVTVYDTGQHLISGVQQSNPGQWTFTSQHGEVNLKTLKTVR